MTTEKMRDSRFFLTTTEAHRVFFKHRGKTGEHRDHRDMGECSFLSLCGLSIGRNDDSHRPFVPLGVHSENPNSWKTLSF